jgi:hypothetical protein
LAAGARLQVAAGCRNPVAISARKDEREQDKSCSLDHTIFRYFSVL